MTTLETPRLLLRRFTLADAQHMAELESDPEVMKFTPSRVPFTFLQTQERLKELVGKEEGYAPLGVWAALFKHSHDFAGWLMLINSGKEAPELGFMIVRRQWGKGIASEAASRLLQFGFKELSLPTVMATTDQSNHASKAVLKKLGFHFTTVISAPDKLHIQVSLDLFTLKRPHST